MNRARSGAGSSPSARESAAVPPAMGTFSWGCARTVADSATVKRAKVRHWIAPDRQRIVDRAEGAIEVEMRPDIIKRYKAAIRSRGERQLEEGGVFGCFCWRQSHRATLHAARPTAPPFSRR